MALIHILEYHIGRALLEMQRALDIHPKQPYEPPPFDAYIVHLRLSLFDFIEGILFELTIFVSSVHAF